MKQAKVVSVEFRDAPASADAAPHEPSKASFAADALRRYPRISDQERRRLVRFLRRASRTEIRDSILRKGLEPRLIGFRKDHKAELRSRWTALAPALFALLLFAELLRLLS